MVAGKLVVNCVQTRFSSLVEIGLRIHQHIQKECLVEQNVNSAKLIEYCLLIVLLTSSNFIHLFTLWTFQFFV